jgi:predicted CxxxxCH...CXXCH cytochrome family protein
MRKFWRVFGGGAAAVALTLAVGSSADLKEDLPAPVAPGGVHEQSWNEPAAEAFHGRYLKANQWVDAECTPCHAQNYSGGTSGVSCLTCHASYPHRTAFTGGGHRGYLARSSYPLPECRSCHGTSYTGGAIVDASCSRTGCHVDRNGVAKSPEACTTCHGVFRAPASDFLSAAPPKSVAGDTATTNPAVGAHASHLVTAAIGRDVRCAECHTVPSSVFDGGHIDGPRAEVVFNDTLARLVTGNGTYVPAGVAYDPGTSRCANTYCHGNWRATKSSAPAQYQFAYSDSVITGSNASPLWTGGSAGAACGTCHGLPPAGHAPLPACNGCHGNVVDAQLNIVDRSKHINGKINVMIGTTASERPF